jgi:hypothetical protein
MSMSSTQAILLLLKEVSVSHPLVIAMRASIFAEKGREGIDTVRIPLPIEAMHIPSTETDDNFLLWICVLYQVRWI